MCLQLLRQLCGHHKGEGELQVMTEAFCAGRRQRQSEVAPELRERMYQVRLFWYCGGWGARGFEEPGSGHEKQVEEGGVCAGNRGDRLGCRP